MATVNPDDMILVSVDDHICEPADMFDAHVPARYRDLAPRVVLAPDGRQQWWYGDIEGRMLGIQAAAGKPAEFICRDAIRYDQMRAGCYDVHARVRDMDAGGQLAGLNFPNWPGFAAPVLNQGPDPDINEIMIKAYNDWHVDEWCGSYPDRFIPCGVLPLFDVDRAADEVRRLAAKGCHAVSISENPTTLGLPSIHTGHWDPLFAACCDVGTIPCLHLGSSSVDLLAPAGTPPGIATSWVLSITSARVVPSLLDLIWGDFWSRFPSLKISLTEGDIGWIPYFLWRTEKVQQRHAPHTKVVFPDGGSPTQVFLDHVVCCFVNDAIGVELLEHFNVDNVCWESDYPHSDSSWPEAPESLGELFDGVADDVVDRVTHENAMRLFQFDPFAHRAREACTVAALRATATDVDTTTYVGWSADWPDPDSWSSPTATRV